MWEYTPRQIEGYLHFASVRERHEAARDLSIGTLAARGEKKSLDKRMKELTKE